MTTLDQALAYAAAGLPVFPCAPRKTPLLKGWPEAATRDAVIIGGWWRRWPNALIGMPTGPASGRNILDVDVKDPKAWGFDTLDFHGFAILPVTCLSHTQSGGLHLHFNAVPKIRNTVGQKGRGIGPGLDWRGSGGYVVLPSEGSGYSWDPHYGPDTPLAAAPLELLPREPEAPQTTGKPVRPTDGLSPYAHAALKSACLAIENAPNGEQEEILNSESYSIGRLAGAGAIPKAFARDALRWSARKIPSFDQKRPWRAIDLERKVNTAFDAGLRHPREVQHV